MEQIGKYKIVEKIGQGATSTVYKGYDPVLGRYVAVKAISAEAGGDETLRKRFQREAQSAARLAHPHIVTVYDYGQEQDKLYMAMELLEGHDLKGALAEGRFKTLGEKLDVMEQVAEGLSHAHANQIVHRDLKPANIHVGSGQVKIMDFGLARLSGSDMTRTGLVIGTPHYMSPEQVRGEHVDARSDVFSLGCVFYQVLTGQKPFDGDSLHALLYKVMQAQPRPVREMVPDLPPVIEQVLERALARVPGDRFADAGAFAAALRAAREAVETGRGDERLPDLDLGAPAPAGPTGEADGSSPTVLVPPPAEAPNAQAAPAAAAPVAAAPARPARTASAASASSGARARPRSQPSVSRPGSSVGTFGWIALVGLLVLLGGGAGAYFAFRPAAAPPLPATPTVPPELGRITQQLAETRAGLAARRLEAGDYEEAYRLAEGAASLAPSNPLARDVLRRAGEARDQVAKALATVKERPTEADAWWALWLADPDHPGEAASPASLDAALRPRAEEARALARAAKQAADEGRGQSRRPDVYRDAGDLMRGAEASLQKGAFGAAARDFLRARNRFARSATSAR